MEMKHKKYIYFSKIWLMLWKCQQLINQQNKRVTIYIVKLLPFLLQSSLLNFVREVYHLYLIKFKINTLHELEIQV